MSGCLAAVAPQLGRLVAQADGDPGLAPGGLTPEARVFVAVVGLGAVVFILLLLRRRQLRGKYALLWTGLAAALGLLGLFPGLLTAVSEAVGIYYPPALFLLVCVGFLFAVVIQFSWELSRLEDRSRILAEELALLRAGPPPERADEPTTAGSDPSGPGPSAPDLGPPRADHGA